MSASVLLSSEHSTNAVPKKFKSLFEKDPEILKTHRGWDPGVGALEKAFGKVFPQSFAKRKGDFPRGDFPKGQVSRLLIELNRSLHHPRLFSEFSREVSDATKQELIEQYYQPYRDELRCRVNEILRAKQWCLHFSLHTFTPVWDGFERNVDVGFLYNPSRKLEKNFVDRWIAKLKLQNSQLRIRRNNPYRGTADGLTTAFRKEFQNYAGIEIELNQAIATQPEVSRKVAQQLASTAAELIMEG